LPSTWLKAGDYAFVAALKGRRRKGWTYEKAIPSDDVESVAEHSFGTASLCLSLCPPELDREKAARMALAHDFAEASVPDYTPRDAIAPEEKFRQEKAAFERMAAPELMELWLEFEARETALARFVRAMDKLDCLLQALAYWRRYKIDLRNWLPSLLPAIPRRHLENLFPDGVVGPFRLSDFELSN
jgi:putative hydrolase of HD superfamily